MKIEMVTIYWRDIPAQVVVKRGRKRVRKQLSDRFQHGIDRAAMRAKKTSADAYIDDWRRISESVEGDMDELLAQQASKLEQDYPEERLESIIRNKGLNPE